MSDDLLEPAVWHRLHPLSPLVRAGRATIGIVDRAHPVRCSSGADSSQLAATSSASSACCSCSASSPGSSPAGASRTTTSGSRPASSAGSRCASRSRRCRRSTSCGPASPASFGSPSCGCAWRGSTGGTARLAYLHEREAEPLRARLLALAHGARRAARGTGADEPAEARRGARADLRSDGPADRVDPPQRRRLRRRCAILTGLIVGAVVAPSRGAGGAQRRRGADHRRRDALLAALQPGVPLHARRGGRRAAAPLGPHRADLGDDPARPGAGRADGRAVPLAAVRLVPPRGRRRRPSAPQGRGGGRSASSCARCCPVGSRALAAELLERILPDAPSPDRRRRAAALFKSPLRYRFLAWGRTDTCVVTSTGRIRRVTSWVPLAKAQSLRRVQGPRPAAASARVAPSRHRRPQRARDAARPGCGRGGRGTRRARAGSRASARPAGRLRNQGRREVTGAPAAASPVHRRGDGAVRRRIPRSRRCWSAAPSRTGLRGRTPIST